MFTTQVEFTTAKRTVLVLHGLAEKFVGFTELGIKHSAPKEYRHGQMKCIHKNMNRNQNMNRKTLFSNIQLRYRNYATCQFNLHRKKSRYLWVLVHIYISFVHDYMHS